MKRSRIFGNIVRNIVLGVMTESLPRCAPIVFLRAWKNISIQVPLGVSVVNMACNNNYRGNTLTRYGFTHSTHDMSIPWACRCSRQVSGICR